jgi:peptidoglycan hydrolase FlgJ
MAIAIASDLVLDVVKAAYPERVRLAKTGLQSGVGPAPQFAEAVTEVHQTSGIGRLLSTDIVGDVVKAANPDKLQGNVMRLAGGVDATQKSYQKFEATVLRSFVEEMLPKSTDTLYGAGTAGNVWRSMQADFMSQELAESGGIGIAKSLARRDAQKADGASLNQIVPQANGAGHSITNTAEWPYFSLSTIGVMES